jgi:hypothetical protein
MKLTGFEDIRGEEGGILLASLVMAAILGIALTAVLNMSFQEHKLLSRAIEWNIALPAAEAGIEEAMSHLQEVDGGSRAAHGWREEDGGYFLARQLGDARFEVVISPDTPPMITSTGYVPSIAAGGGEVRRRIQVRTKGQGLFTKGVVAGDWIKMRGQILLDSFDSSDYHFSTDGRYDPVKRKDNGDLATNGSTENAIELNGAQIYGSVSIGPEGEIKMSGGAAAGSSSYIESGKTGIEQERYHRDMNVSFPKVDQPFASGFTPFSGIVHDIYYKHVLTNGDYQLATLTLSGSDKMLVRGTARLLVVRDVNISESAFIQINTGADLQLFVAEGAISLSGEAIINEEGKAENFSIWGMPELIEITIYGDGSFAGTLYAPQAHLRLEGAGSAGFDFVGAIISRTLDCSGHYRFHYDEVLGGGGGRNLVIVSWRES